MAYQLDHAVVWVADPAVSVAFYRDIVGLEPVRLAEYEAGTAPFVSARLSDATVLDLMPLSNAPKLNAAPGAEGSAGNLLNHLCLAMTEPEFEALLARLEAAGHPITGETQNSFGARGLAPRAVYFRDPDGNIFEARYYEE